MKIWMDDAQAALYGVRIGRSILYKGGAKLLCDCGTLKREQLRGRRLQLKFFIKNLQIIEIFVIIYM